MPEQKEIVINTSPLLALIAAWGMLDPLKSLYRKIWVPYEVGAEIEQGGSSGFGVSEFRSAGFLTRLESPLTISPFLENSLDRGEAAVIQAAIDRNIRIVCIDEIVGRRIARLNGLQLTGSLGILVRAYREGHEFSMEEAIARMQDRGVRLSERVIRFALAQARIE